VNLLRHSIALYGALLLAIVLAGCTTVPEPVPEISGQWKGRFSMTVVGPDGTDTEDSNEDRAQGRFELRKQAGKMDLRILSPFGQTMAQATATKGAATLKTSEGKTFTAGSANELLLNALGWRIPVESFPDWLTGTGLPSDNSTVQTDGWNVRVEKRLSSGKPRIIAASWPVNAKITETSLKLLIVIAGR
jgi:outer membrane lipoprotein LolB